MVLPMTNDKGPGTKDQGQVTKCIIFDFGNVIGFFDYDRAGERLAPHCDLSADAIVAAVRGDPLHDDYESGRLTTAEFLRRARDLCRFRCSDAELIDAYVDIFWPNNDVIALLPRLHGKYRLLLGSNTSDLHTRQFRRQFAEALKVFDGMVLSHEVGVRKPKAAFFERCLRVADCAPSECVFIDDLPVNVAGAVACNMKGIVYRDADDLSARFGELGIHWA